jgi:hypothetical protein
MGVDDGADDDPSWNGDADGLTNRQEYLLGTDPSRIDTDGDNTWDLQDAAPLDPTVQ